VRSEYSELFALVWEVQHRFTGHVCVLENSFYTFTDAAGKFTLFDLPAATYMIEAAHPDVKRQELKFTMTNANRTVNFTLPEGGPKKPLYAVRAGGPHSFVGLLNAPEANAARLSFERWEYESPPTASLRITNGEPVSIMVWNVRVQTKSSGRGTDGFGWDAVSDDYPAGDIKAWYKPGESATFHWKMAGKPPWRVCVLYSKKPTELRKGSRVSPVGDFEIISDESEPQKPISDQ
jgi:hypothetical protein